MSTLKQKRLKVLSAGKVCADGRCPAGIDSLKTIALSKPEKRAIYFELKAEIFKQKRLLRDLAALA